MRNFENDPIYMNDGGGGFGGNSMWPIILLALLGGNRNGGLFGGNGAGPGTVVAEQNLSDLRKDVSDVKASVKETILEQTIADQSEFRSLDNRLFQVEKDALKEGFASQIKILESNNILSREIEHKAAHTDEKINRVEINMDKSFCELSHRLERDFRVLSEQRLVEENRVLRERLFADSQFAQTNAIVNAINGLRVAGVTIPTPLVSAITPTKVTA